jgi:hypothetical protein
MKITAKKIKRELEKNYGWSNMNVEENSFMINELIKDTLKIINDLLVMHKGISIK